MARPRSLVLITVDCLRADRVATQGDRASITPFLDSLVGESFVFRNAYASGIPTYYSLPALFASRYPLALGRDVIGIAPGESTVATELKECGFRTAAFVAGNPYVCSADGYDAGFGVFRNFLTAEDIEFEETQQSSPRLLRGRANQLLSKACHSLPGFGAAYDEIYFQYCQRSVRDNNASFDELRKFPSADVIVDCAIAWLQQNAASPFFLWLHLMDPHAPYYPKAEALADSGSKLGPQEARRLNSLWAREGLSSGRRRKNCGPIKSLYDAGVRWADQQIGRLANRLVDLNLWDQCAFAVTADHGEEFLDHGGRFHPPLNLHEELIRVPLLMRVPGSQGRDVAYPMGLIDLAPTLFDSLDIPAPAAFRGRSCWQRLKNGQSWDWPVFTECAYGCANPFRAEARLASRLLSVRRGEYKLTVNFATGTDDLFEINSAAGETNSLPLGMAGDVRKRLLECAEKHLKECQNSRDLDLRLAARSRELRADWGRPVMRPN